MVATKYIALLTLTMILAFWRLAPWTWLSRMAQMPGTYAALLALEPVDRLTSIQGGVSYLAGARENGDVWMPNFIWRRIVALATERGES
jgi:hypothetical protein